MKRSHKNKKKVSSKEEHQSNNKAIHNIYNVIEEPFPIQIISFATHLDASSSFLLFLFTEELKEGATEQPNRKKEKKSYVKKA